MPQVFVEPGGTDFAQGAIGLGQGLLAGMQIKQSMDLDRQRADMLRAQLMEERRARQVYEGQRQQALDMDREELRFRREDRQRRRDSEMGLVETSLSSLERMLGDDPATEDIRAEIGIAKTRLAPEHLQPYLEQIQAEIEMRHAPLAVEQVGEQALVMADSGVIDEQTAQVYQGQMQRWLESGGADGRDPDEVADELTAIKQSTARRTSTRRYAERTAAIFDEQVAVLPAESQMASDAQTLVELIRLAQDPEEVRELSRELRHLTSGETQEERAYQRALLRTRNMNFFDAEEEEAYFNRVYEAEMDRGGSLRSQQEPAQKPTRGVPDVDKEKLRQALMEALGEGTEQAPRSSSRKTKEEMGGGFLDTIGSIGKAIGGGGAKAAEALGEGMDRASQVRRSRGSRKPQAEPKPKPTQKAPEGDEEVRRELRRAEAKLRRLRQGHPDEKAIEATKKLIAELKAKLGG